MKLSEYFMNKKGVGVLATSDNSGRVNAAIYGRPHFVDEETIAFIASERLTHANLQSNPHAVYLFKEDEGYVGYRLYLKMIREEKDSPMIEDIRRKKYDRRTEPQKTGSKYLLFFNIEKTLPLIGARE